MKVAQNVLDALPVAVLGMDSGGLIVQCNQMASKMFSVVYGSLLGNMRHNVLPEDINRIIDEVIDKGEGFGKWTRGGKRISIRGDMKKFEGRQEVVILVLYEEHDNGQLEVLHG